MHPDLAFAIRRRGGVFTVADARRAGYRPDEVRAAVGSGAWYRLRRGIYVTAQTWAEATDDRSRHVLHALATLTALGPGPVLSHTSAARFHGFLLPRGVDTDVRLTHPDQWRTGPGYRITAATLTADDVLRAGALSVTSAARTLVDCAREWDPADAVVAMDAALHAERVRRRDLVATVMAQSHWLGIGGAARAVQLTDGRAESPLETRGRLGLLAAGFRSFESQVELHGPAGFVARLDGWLDDLGVAVEFDGFVKYADPRDQRTPAEVAWDEKRREDLIRDLDVPVVRIVQADLPRLERPIRRLDELRTRPLPGPRRYRIVRTPEPGSDDGDAAA
ncbi:type IV toxin-antitoxin system AbiEi family antitoxin domain-containing protein [Blastococcus sp. CCUG 61487]|uniref:type IV toxin-antitoxin system AbiEi family antitoxin domain-containing protein n=1 Tax=Blastococcus sp. CCUG 61487 TaxID=1840703 RepID=UPI0010C13BAF|nr:type IV toxin-antitoxin system AbiEi family antitoxin domain-containing protein [Blastococcus sp. CCUG 61487]TKJ23426.1 hypothetical protein A6V29_05330 [Blastococcus sp. CCUG 61487]